MSNYTYYLLSTFFYLFFQMNGLSRVFAQTQHACVIPYTYKARWECLGPFNEPHQTAHQRFGAIASLSVNPNNEQEIYIGTTNAGLFYTTDQGKNWTCLTDNQPWPVIGVNAIHVDYTLTPHKIILACGRGNIWYDAIGTGMLISDDNGLHWSRRYPGQDTLISSPPLCHIWIDPKDATWYVASLSEVFRTQDEGRTWEMILSPKIFPELLPNTDYTITSLLGSADGQSLWLGTRFYGSSQQSNGQIVNPSLYELKNIQGNKNRIELKNQTDVILPSLKPYVKPFAVKLFKSHPSDSSLFVLWQPETHRGSQILKINTETHQVEYFISPNQGSFGEDVEWFHGLIVPAASQNRYYFGGTVLHRSLDSGKTFKTAYPYSQGQDHIPHPDIRSMLILPADGNRKDDHIYLGTDGGLSLSEDGGKQFRNLNGTHLPITECYGLAVSPFSSQVAIGTQDNSIFTYNPFQQTWQGEIRGDGYDVVYSATQPGMLYGQYNALQLYASDQDTAPLFIPLQAPRMKAANRKTLATHTKGNLYMAGSQFQIYEERSKTWNQYPLGLSHEALAFAVSPSDPNRIYLSGFWQGLYASDDGGNSFKDISKQVVVAGHALGYTRIYSICIHPDDPDQLWISQGYLGDYQDICKPGYRILYSSDGGVTWADYSAGLPAYNVTDLRFVEGTSGTLFASTLEGIYLRTQQDSIWRIYGTGLPRCLITEIEIDYRRGCLLASTYGRSVWQIPLPPLTYNAPLRIRKPTTWTALPGEARYLHRNVQLASKALWNIECPVYLGKGVRFSGRGKKKIKFTGNGRFIEAPQ